MKIRIVAVGKVREPNMKALADEYAGRLEHYTNLESFEVKEGRGNPVEVMSEEADSMRSHISDLGAGALSVALDEGGKSWTSRELAQWLNDQMLYGTRYISFVIGGAHGIERELRRDCQFSLSLSKMTLPHEMARVVLYEQLYRAMTIIRGEPYHK